MQKKWLTTPKTYGILTKLLQMSEKLKQFKQFSDSGLTKLLEKKMKKVVLHNLGCNVNSYEIDVMQQML